MRDLPNIENRERLSMFRKKERIDGKIRESFEMCLRRNIRRKYSQIMRNQFLSAAPAYLHFIYNIHIYATHLVKRKLFGLSWSTSTFHSFSQKARWSKLSYPVFVERSSRIAILEMVFSPSFDLLKCVLSFFNLSFINKYSSLAGRHR